MIWKVIALMIVCVQMIFCYALLVVASNADDRAEEFWKEWEKKDDA